MSKYHFFLLLSFFASTAFSQQIPLSGQVSIHNSQYQTERIEYVEGASVSAAFGGATQTDSQGDFNLTFSSVTEGDLIELNIEKTGLEVVNERDILYAVLGRSRPLRVYMAPEGQLAQAQTELYEVSLQAITARYDALIAELRQGGTRSTAIIAELEEQLNQEIEHRFAAEDLLNEKLEALKEQLPETTKRLAQVNMDFASDNYRTAFELYKKGEIEAALEKLDEATLSEESTQVLATLDGIKKNQADYQIALAQEEEKAYQIVESYQLKAEAYNLIFDYRSAVNVYQKAVDLLEALKDGEEDLELADCYVVLSKIYCNVGDYLQGLYYQKKSTIVKEKYLEKGNPELLESYNGLVIVHRNLGEYRKALFFGQKALGFLENHGGDYNETIITLYINIGTIYRNLGESSNALETLKMASLFLDENFNNSQNIVISLYSSLANIYRDLGRYSQALELQQTVVEIARKNWQLNHPYLAIHYNNLSLMYQDVGDHFNSLETQKKALAIRQEVLESNHPDIATSYHNLSRNYSNLKNYDQALIMQQKAIKVREQIFEKYHPSLANSYNNLAGLYSDLGDYLNAILAQRKDIVIVKNVYGFSHPRMALSYHNLAKNLYYQDQLDSAIMYEEKAYGIWEKEIPSTHPNLKNAINSLTFFYKDRAMRYFNDSQFINAIDDFKSVLNFNHENGSIYNLVGLCYYLKGDYLKAIENYNNSYALEGISYGYLLSNTGLAYAKQGNFTEAKHLFQELDKIIFDKGILYCNWSLYYALKNEPEIALDYLEKAIEFGYNDWKWIHNEEALAPLREHQRYKDLLKQAPDE